ncbi:MAG: hypothetical protein ABSG76_14045 [Xanthobacteraceae bacterium]|jgi:hypothetical protein
MSAGHPHRRLNARHEAELARLRRDPAVAARLGRRFAIDTRHDVADLAGYDTAGRTIYIDRHLAAALRAGRLALPGRGNAQVGRIVMRALATHEHTEKALIDAKGYSYPAAHEFATLAEHQLLRSAGVAPHAYEAALKPWIRRISRGPIETPPKQLDCTPYRDDPDRADQRVLAIYRRLGVTDAARPVERDERFPNRERHGVA